MGAGWYVALENAPPAPLPHGGKPLTWAQFQLEEIARAAGVVELKAFFSADPAAVVAYFAEQGIEADADDLPAEEWYDPAEALPVVAAVVAGLDGYGGFLPSPDKVRAGIDALAAILRDAVAAGRRFHIATGLPELSDREPG